MALRTTALLGRPEPESLPAAPPQGLGEAILAFLRYLSPPGSELLGLAGPIGLVGLGRTGIGQTLRALRRGQLPPGRIEPPLSEALRGVELLPPMPPSTSFEQAVASALGRNVAGVKPIPVATPELVHQLAVRAQMGGRPLAAIRPEELESVASVLGRLSPIQQRALAGDPGLLREILPGVAAHFGMAENPLRVMSDELLYIIRLLAGKGLL